MLYKVETSSGLISLLLTLNSNIMASNQLDYSDKIDFSVFGNELVSLSPYVEEVYGSLCNNRLYAFQPNCQME